MGTWGTIHGLDAYLTKCRFDVLARASIAVAACPNLEVKRAVDPMVLLAGAPLENDTYLSFSVPKMLARCSAMVTVPEEQ